MERKDSASKICRCSHMRVYGVGRLAFASGTSFDPSVYTCEVSYSEPLLLIETFILLCTFLCSHFDLPAGCVSWRSVFPEAFSSKKDVNAKITSAFANLSGILRTAKGLPLMITNIHGMSPYLRDTEVRGS